MVVFPALALLSLAIIARRLEGAWLAPGAFFASAWTLFVSAPLLFASRLPEYLAGLWWICLCALVVLAGSLMARRVRHKPGISTRRKAKFPGLVLAILILSSLGLIATQALLSSRGLSMTVFLSVSDLSRVAHEFSVARYLQGYKEPPLEQIGAACFYAGALLGGALLAAPGYRRRMRLIALAPLIPAAGVTLVDTTKAVMLLTLLLMLVAYLAMRVRYGGIPRKAMLAVTVIALALAPASLFVQLNRANFSFTNPSEVQAVLPSLEVSIFGSVPAFTYWFDHQGNGSQLSWGAVSFSGPADLLFPAQATRGHAGDYVVFGPGVLSNVYTMFRDLIADFGTTGSLLVLLALGFAARVAFDRVLDGRLMPVVPLSGFYAITLFGFIINPFSFTTVVVAWLAWLSYLFIARGRADSRSVVAPGVKAA